MHDADLDRLLREHGSDYNRARRDPPLDEMWRVIEQSVSASEKHPNRRRSALLFLFTSGIAAAVLLGFIWGRNTSSAPTPPLESTYTQPSESADSAALPYRTVASRYLGQTALFLYSLESSTGGAVDTTVTRRAGELLTTTRLLLDSPAAADVQLRILMSDVELVLAQINRMHSTRVAAEWELIADALHSHDLLPRLRTLAVRAAGN